MIQAEFLLARQILDVSIKLVKQLDKVPFRTFCKLQIDDPFYIFDCFQIIDSLLRLSP